MGEALAEARLAAGSGERPVGAVAVVNDALRFRIERTLPREEEHLARLHARKPDNVKTKLGFDQPGRITRFHREHSVFERLDHHALAKEIQIAAALGRAARAKAVLAHF